jgi:DNA mismatch endonuclease, patch repair protein
MGSELRSEPSQTRHKGVTRAVTNELDPSKSNCPPLAPSFAPPSSWIEYPSAVTDIFTRAKRSAIMAAIRSSGNKATELKMIMLFRQFRVTGWRRGVQLPGSPDFVFRRAKLAVFTDGCFWHGCRLHAHLPVSNRLYWEPKMNKNRARDRRANRELRRRGWRVLRVWQHELQRPHKVITRILRLLERHG